MKNAIQVAVAANASFPVGVWSLIPFDTIVESNNPLLTPAVGSSTIIVNGFQGYVRCTLNLYGLSLSGGWVGAGFNVFTIGSDRFFDFKILPVAGDSVQLAGSLVMQVQPGTVLLPYVYVGATFTLYGEAAYGYLQRLTVETL
jgi:hypothetical protein